VWIKFSTSFRGIKIIFFYCFDCICYVNSEPARFWIGLLRYSGVDTTSPERFNGNSIRDNNETILLLWRVIFRVGYVLKPVRVFLKLNATYPICPTTARTLRQSLVFCRAAPWIQSVNFPCRSLDELWQIWSGRRMVGRRDGLIHVARDCRAI